MPVFKKNKQLSGWGNYPKSVCTIYRPEKQKEAIDTLNKNNNLITRGQGRSYGDASLNKDCTILTDRLDKFINFDSDSGVLTVQSGVTFSEILDVFIPRGWILPVIPGTKYVSAGGAFACNVHGKNHFKVGDFANHVTNIKLVLASGEEIECSPNNDQDIFWATAGGMGLTGFIKEISIKLTPIKSLSLLSRAKKTCNISEMLDCFKAERSSSDYMIGWIDHFATGTNLGRGVFESATHIDISKGKKLSEHKMSGEGITIPIFFPAFILNKYSMALYNRYRFRKYSAGWLEKIVDFDGFFHPLDSLKLWNRMYGKNGFFQYQFILPETDDVESKLSEILSFIQESGHFSFLAVIKYHGEHQGMLSFPMRGYSVALDFPNNTKVRHLQNELNRKIADMEGRIYLAKDALLTECLFEKMYVNELPNWRRIIKKIDPDNKFNSLMSTRLNMRGGVNGE